MTKFASERASYDHDAFQFESVAIGAEIKRKRLGDLFLEDRSEAHVVEQPEEWRELLARISIRIQEDLKGYEAAAMLRCEEDWPLTAESFLTQLLAQEQKAAFVVLCDEPLNFDGMQRVVPFDFLEGSLFDFGPSLYGVYYDERAALKAADYWNKQQEASSEKEYDEGASYPEGDERVDRYMADCSF